MAWEKLGTASVGGAGVANNSWKELARATVGSGGATSTTTSAFTAKENMMILYQSFGADPYLRVGYSSIDTGSNYAQRYSENGGSDGTHTSQSLWYANGGAGATGSEGVFGVTEGINIAAQEKLFTLNSADNASGTGAGTAPGRYERAMKWTNTSNQINIVRMYHSSGTMVEGSEVVVLGYNNDEADSGTNFWQELASVELGSSGTSISSGTFTAKKYLMFELTKEKTGGYVNPKIEFNSDTGSNYASRYSDNGGSDATSTSQSNIDMRAGENDGRSHTVGYIINKSDKEKLMISNTVNSNTEGAGNATGRAEVVGKWSNTSSQITSINFSKSASGSFNTGTTLKVYGAD